MNDDKMRISFEPSEELVQSVDDLQVVIDFYLSLTLPSHVVWENETNNMSNPSKPKMTAQVSPSSSRSPSPSKGNNNNPTTNMYCILLYIYLFVLFYVLFISNDLFFMYLFVYLFIYLFIYLLFIYLFIIDCCFFSIYVFVCISLFSLIVFFFFFFGYYCCS
jgi:hypothetical protein